MLMILLRQQDYQNPNRHLLHYRHHIILPLLVLCLLIQPLIVPQQVLYNISPSLCMTYLMQSFKLVNFSMHLQLNIFKIVIRILRYDKSTLSYILHSTHPHPSSLIGYSDAYLAWCIENHCSSYGQSIFLSGKLVSWRAKSNLLPLDQVVNQSVEKWLILLLKLYGLLICQVNFLLCLRIALFYYGTTKVDYFSVKTPSPTNRRNILILATILFMNQQLRDVCTHVLFQHRCGLPTFLPKAYRVLYSSNFVRSYVLVHKLYA